MHLRADPDWRPNLSDASVQRALQPRAAPYYNLIEYCRHIGLHVRSAHQSFWVARVRNRNGGYRQKRLAPAWLGDLQKNTFEDALALAKDWFASPSISRISSTPYPVGSKTALCICPIGDEYTVGHALKAYIEWKRISARQSHFLTTVSLINHHLVPSTSQILLKDFNGQHFHDLAVRVLEMEPKTRRTQVPKRVPISQLSEEALRKRRKTFNALVSVLRGAFDLAWEQSYLHSDRAIRCLRRLPNADRPRVIYLDRTECNRLIAACPNDLAALVKGVLYTGCRISELTAMRVGDYSAKHRSIVVHSHKGSKTRQVMLPSEGCAFFDSLAARRPKNAIMFLRPMNRRWGSEYKDHFRKARIAAGLGEEVTMHGLRHTYASQLVEAGASLIVVADQLGHANTQTVSTTYGHLAASTRASVVESCFATLQQVGDEVRPSSLSRLQDERQNDLDAHSKLIPAWPRSNHFKAGADLIFASTRKHGGNWSG